MADVPQCARRSAWRSAPRGRLPIHHREVPMNSPALQTRTEHRQHQTLTPRLQHAVRLLQLSSLDFAQEVQEAMGRNPFLEVEDSPPDAGRVEVGTLNGDGEPRGIDLEATAPIADAPYERENWQQSSSSVR